MVGTGIGGINQHSCTVKNKTKHDFVNKNKDY